MECKSLNNFERGPPKDYSCEIPQCNLEEMLFKAAYSVTMNIFSKNFIFILNHL